MRTRNHERVGGLAVLGLIEIHEGLTLAELPGRVKLDQANGSVAGLEVDGSSACSEQAGGVLVAGGERIEVGTVG